MLTPEACATFYPFSTSFWGSHGTPQLPLYRTMVFSPPAFGLPPTSSKRHYPPRGRVKGPSSFTIDAILGLGDGDGDAVAGGRTVIGPPACRRDPTARRHRRESAERPRSGAPSPGAATAALRAAPPAHRHRPDPAEEAASRHGGDGASGPDHELWDNLEGAGGAEREIFDRDDVCMGVKQGGASLGWLSNLPEHIGKPKRVRTIFTQDQLERLEKEFARQQYMVGTERLYLAAQLDLSESQVKVWFQNRRIKWRKQNLESQQERLAQYRALREKERLESKANLSRERAGAPAPDADVTSDVTTRGSNGVYRGSPSGHSEASEVQGEARSREEKCVFSTSHTSPRDAVNPST